MGLLVALLFCWLLWKVGILTVKLIGILFVLAMIGLFIHILLIPAIIISVIILGWGIFIN